MNIYDIERLPVIRTGWEVKEGISIEWDFFWLIPEDSLLNYFEIYPNFRSNRLHYDFDLKEKVRE